MNRWIDDERNENIILNFGELVQHSIRQGFNVSWDSRRTLEWGLIYMLQNWHISCPPEKSQNPTSMPKKSTIYCKLKADLIRSKHWFPARLWRQDPKLCLIGFCGRLCFQKGIHLILDWLHDAPKMGLEVQVLLEYSTILPLIARTDENSLCSTVFLCWSSFSFTKNWILTTWWHPPQSAKAGLPVMADARWGGSVLGSRFVHPAKRYQLRSSRY